MTAAGLDASVDLLIGGMTCGACANRVQRVLNKIDGVTAVVNYATGAASVAVTGRATTDDLIAAVVKAGYSAELPTPAAPATQPDADDVLAPDPVLAELRNRLLVCAALSLPVIVLTVVSGWQFTYWQWACLTLAAPVAVWGAFPFHRAAVKNAVHGAASMDTLVSLGTLAAFGWSLYALFLGRAGRPGLKHPFTFTIEPSYSTHHIYLEVAAGITTFVLAGRYIEARARRRSGAAIEALSKLAAKDVAVLGPDGERRIPVEQLAVGDRFVVRPGEKVAADGVVVEGASAIDAGMLTGEAVPAEVGAGDPVTGGCVNVGGRLVVQTTCVGAESRLAQITALVTRAQAGKAAVQRLADRICGVFVPVVLVLAVGTFAVWLARGADAPVASLAAVAVLIVACVRARWAWPPPPRCSWAPAAAPSSASWSRARRRWNAPAASTPSWWTRPAPSPPVRCPWPPSSAVTARTSTRCSPSPEHWRAPRLTPSPAPSPRTPAAMSAPCPTCTGSPAPTVWASAVTSRAATPSSAGPGWSSTTAAPSLRCSPRR